MTHDKKIFLVFINVFINAIVLVLSIVSFMLAPKSVIATVDMAAILSKASHALASFYPKGDVPKTVLSRLIHHIKQTTESFGQEKNVLIIDKQCVFSSESHDLTEKIVEKLLQENVFKEGPRDGE